MAENIYLSQQSPSQLSLNIKDVLDVIQDQEERDLLEMFGGAPSETNYTAVSSMSQMETSEDPKKHAYVQITEQPQPKALRFRYICEGRSAGSIPGVCSTSDNKTYPSLKICNYKGPAFVVVSLVTAEAPYRPHPHNLVGKSCKNGICTMKITNDSMECMFSNLGIQCVKRKEVEHALDLRKDQRVDPFRTGFAHQNQLQGIDLNSVRLCFQVFLEGREKGKFTYPLQPVVSDTIYDKKATSDLNICKLSDCSSTVCGGKEIILLCDKVTKEDIQVKFFEIKDDRISWEAVGDFQAADVHKQVAISFKTPKYKDLEIQNPVKVFVQLVRPSDQSKSDPRPFEYVPMDSGMAFRSLKRLKNNYGLFYRILGVDNNANPVETADDDVLPHKKALSPTMQIPDCENSSKLITDSPPLISLSPSPSAATTSPIDTPLHTIPRVPIAQPQNESAEASVAKRRVVHGTSSSTNDDRGGFAKQLLSPERKHSPLWTEDHSVYSGADILDDVFSQGESVNDILSAVGGEFSVYEDLANLNQQPDIPPCGPTDPIYGDASYASCYSNLEFVLGRAKASQDQVAPNTLPFLPPKGPPSKDVENNDFAIYGTPSGKPIHPNKQALLRERGFLANDEDNDKKDADDMMYHSPSSDILEIDEETDVQNSKELPKSILDLFV